MKKTGLFILSIALFLHIANCQSVDTNVGTIQATNLSADEKKAITTVRKFISFVRYSKNSDKFSNKAVEQIDLDYVCNYLINNKLSAHSKDEQNKFKQLIAEHVKLKAFPIALKYFEKIDLVYEKPSTQSDKIIIPSTLVYKGSDKMKFSWVINKKNFMIIDILNENKTSSMQGSRDRQILPFYTKQGMKGLLQKLEEINARLR